MPTQAKTCGACGAPEQHGAFCDECGAALPDMTPAPEPAATLVSAPAAVPAATPAPGPSSAPAPEPSPEVIPAPVPVSAAEEPAREPSSAEAWALLMKRVAEAQRGQVPPPADQEPATLAEEPATLAEQPVTIADQPVRAAAGTERARALVVPVNDPAAGPAAVSPVLPGRPEPALPSTVRMPETGVSVGGPPCPWCGTPNPAGRHFCRRCAMSLAEPPGAGPVHRPWWRRLLDWRGGEIPYAGQRPRLRRDPGQLFRWAATLAIVIVVISAVATWGGTAVGAVENHFTSRHFQPVASMTASGSDKSHPDSNLHDGWNNTWWGDGVTGNGAGMHIDAAFAQPQNLLDIVITPGAGVAQDAFTAESSPQTIDLTMTAADGTTTSQTLSLVDSPGPQTIAVHGSDITSVRLTIESAYTGSSPNPEVAIAEIEFFTKS